MLSKMDERIKLLKNKVRLVRAVATGDIALASFLEEGFERELDTAAYEKIDGGYDYLLNIPLRTITKDRAKALAEDLQNQRDKREVLDRKTAEELWMEDLEVVEPLL